MEKGYFCKKNYVFNSSWYFFVTDTPELIQKNISESEKEELKKLSQAPKKGNKLKCSVCPKEFRDKANLNLHMTKHGIQQKVDEKRFKKPDIDFKQRIKDLRCKLCTKQFLKQNLLDLHMKNHAPPSHACPECSKMFYTESQLEAHLLHIQKVDLERLVLVTLAENVIAELQELSSLNEVPEVMTQIPHSSNSVTMVNSQKSNSKKKIEAPIAFEYEDNVDIDLNNFQDSQQHVDETLRDTFDNEVSTDNVEAFSDIQGSPSNDEIQEQTTTGSTIR